MKSLSRNARCTAYVFALIFTLNQFADAQAHSSPAATQAAIPTAPPPSQIASAHTILLANSGAAANFPIDATQSYNDIYAALQAWGHYKLVNTPEQADLVLQLRGIAPLTNIIGTDDNVSSVTSPAFQLAFIDSKTNISLWTITSPVYVVGKKDIRARWISISETNLVSRIKVLAGQPLSGTESADLTTVPKLHRGRTALILVGATVAVGVGGGLLLHHEYENGLANQKSSQDAFCTAHNIPLTMCAGG